MFRALSILAAVAALAVTAAPVGSAAKAPPKPPSGTNWIDKPSPDLMPLKAKPKAPAQKRARPKPLGLSVASSEVFELNTAKGRGAGKSLVWSNGDGND